MKTLLFLLLFCSTAQACSRDINLLAPEAKKKFIQLKQEAARDGIRIEPICTYRSPEEHRALYARGRTRPGPKVTWTKTSKHSQRRAFDIAVYAGKTISWSPDRYRHVANIAKKIGGLTWGGDWKVRDYGHYELKEK